MLHTEYGVLVYARFDQDDTFVIAINNAQRDVTIPIPVWRLGVLTNTLMVSLIATNRESYSLEAKIYTVTDGYVRVALTPESGVVLKNLRS